METQLVRLDKPYNIICGPDIKFGLHLATLIVVNEKPVKDAETGDVVDTYPVAKSYPVVGVEYGIDGEVDGCIKRGVPEKVAEEIFSEMESFASYAFNKSHAACYAVLSYQTAYMKCYYPCEYMAALLTSVLGDRAKIAVYADECTQKHISVLPPNVNESSVGFSVHDNEIRFGLKAVKNLGRGFIDSMITERNKKKFTSFYDYGRVPFFESVKGHNILMYSQDYLQSANGINSVTRLYEHNAGEYNNFFGVYKRFWTELICHSDGTENDSTLLDKTWTNVGFQFDTFDDSKATPSEKYKESERFDMVECSTEYQQGITDWRSSYPGISKTFRMWNADLPRDGYTLEHQGYTSDRFRNPWLRLRLTKKENINKNWRSVLHSVTIGYLE